MHGSAQAFCQACEADRRLVPFAVTDALDVIENITAVEYRRRLAKRESLHFLRAGIGRGRAVIALAVFTFTHQ